MKKKAKKTASKTTPKIRVEPPFADQVAVKIQLPAPLLKWADEKAFDMDYFLSDYIRGLLEGEKLQEGRLWVTHVPAAREQGLDCWRTKD